MSPRLHPKTRSSTAAAFAVSRWSFDRSGTSPSAMAASVEDNERPTAKSRLSPTWQTLANGPSKLSGTTRSEFRFYPKLQGARYLAQSLVACGRIAFRLVSLDLLFLEL